jgi:hypothetical protein
MTDECDFRVTLLGTGVPAHLTIPQQHEPITYAFGVDQLVDRKNETAATAGNVTDHAHDLARLPQVEPIERLVHEKDRLRGEQREGQHESTAVSLR